MTKGRALTTKTVEAMKPDPEKRREVPDPAISGLYLVVQPSGAKSWALRYRHAGKPKKLTLGKWPVMGVADARAAASEAIEKVEHGSDPSAAKRAEKAALRDADLAQRDKIKTLVGQFEKRHLAHLRSGKTVKRELERHVVSVWGDRDVQEIGRRDVIDLLDGIVDSGRATSANRVRAYLSKFFNWLIERGVIDASPMAGVKAPAKEKSRERVLSDEEIRRFWRACERVGEPWGSLGRVLLLTGQRLGEVSGMSDGEIEGATWHLPAARVKNGRAHDVPLSGAAAKALAGVDRIADPDGNVRFIFTTTGETPVSGFAKGRDHIASKMQEIAAEERGEGFEIPHWTFHDLRRTCATGMARMGIPVRVTEAVLNHVSGTGGGIVAVYQRHDYADEKRQALEAWARYVERLANGGSANIVSISEARG